MNKYVIPYYDFRKRKVGIRIILARSLKDCEEKLASVYGVESDYDDFLDEMEGKVAFGQITDIEEL